MDAINDASMGYPRAIIKTVVALSLPFVLSPCEVASEAATNVMGAFTTCFRRLRPRRPLFNDDPNEALLTDDERFSEAAMMELRRRIMESSAPTMRWGSMATDQPSLPSRWKQRKMQEEAKCTLFQNKMSPYLTRLGIKEEQEAFTALASVTGRALDEILESTNMSRKYPKPNETLALDDSAQLDADEKFLKHGNSDPEKSIGEFLLLDLPDDDEDSSDGSLLNWLAEIDISRSMEYCAYAKPLKKRGFSTLEDLAQLKSDDDVDLAMSEVGIAKFSHRLRIRKAIQQLHFTHVRDTVRTAAGAW